MSRDYKGDLPSNCIDKFMNIVLEREDEGSVSPILKVEDITYMYIKHSNLFRTFSDS